MHFNLKGDILIRKEYLLVLCLLIAIAICLGSCSPVPTPAITSTPSTVSAATSTPTTFSTPIMESTPTQVLTPTVLPQLYTVKAGDTLWNISQIYGVPVAFIAIKNGLTDADTIYPGQVLNIPDPLATPPEVSSTGKQIVVILSLQKLYAYDNGVVVKDFLVSTGVAAHPTVLGTYSIYQKLPSTRMTGEGYDLSDVPWTMYFYEDYGIHGTYWHHNFGQPMSHGCVNMQTDEAKWLYDWSPLGTSVLILP